jgi:hypothetical protein
MIQGTLPAEIVNWADSGLGKVSPLAVMYVNFA